MGDYELYNGDCMELLKDIPDDSVDLVLCDLPYGTIAHTPNLKGWNKTEKNCAWDIRLDTKILFDEYLRVLRTGGRAVLFSQEPLTSELRISGNTNFMFQYSMVWLKNHFANYLGCKKQPVMMTEDLSVFCKVYDTGRKNPLRAYSRKVMDFLNKPVQNILDKGGLSLARFLRSDAIQFGLCNEKSYNWLIENEGLDKMEGFLCYDELRKIANGFGRKVFNIPDGTKVVPNVFSVNKEADRYHPTQKPVALCSQLISLFSNEGDTVLDNCMGSGSTGVSCMSMRRRFIGMEMSRDYYDVAEQRIKGADSQNWLF